MALLPTLLAIGIGVALGLHWGGRVDNLLAWRPPLWQALGAGVSLLVVLDLVPIGGAFAAFLRILAMVAAMACSMVEPFCTCCPVTSSARRRNSSLRAERNLAMPLGLSGAGTEAR